MMLQDKVNRCITRLYKLPENGGNPFLFAIAYPKPQEIAVEINGGQAFETAATDGKKFYWNPDFLEALSEDEVATVMCHEIYHVLFFHPTRMRGKDGNVANIAMDYSVNNTVEEEHEKSGRSKKYQLWGTQKLGKPVAFADLLSYIDGKTELPKAPSVFVDSKVRNRSPESLYDEIMRHWDKSPRKCKAEHGGCGALSMDPKTGKPLKPGPYAPGSCPKCGTPPRSTAKRFCTI
jgi:Putative metallopeptidase domain